MSDITSKPSVEISSSLPIKGETYVAPALAANNAWPDENINVQLHDIPSASNYFTAWIPSQVPAIFIKILFLGTPDCS